MIKKYQRKIAILLIALLVFPMNIFSSIGAVLAQDGDEETYSMVYETDFSEEGHNVRMSPNTPGGVVEGEIEIGEDTYTPFYVGERTNGWETPTLSFADADIEVGNHYRITVEYYSDVAEIGDVSYQLTTDDYANGDVDLITSIVPNEIVEMTFDGIIDTASNELRFQTTDTETPYYLLSVKVEILNTEDAVEPEEPGDEDEDDDVTEPVEDFEPYNIAEFNFEESNEGFGQNGTATVARTDEEAYEGEYSLKVTGRGGEPWHGAQVVVDEDIYEGATYKISGYVKAISEVAEPTEFKATINGIYHQWAAVNLEDNEWTSFEGTYTNYDELETIPIYFESADVDMEFYLDNIVVELVNLGEEDEDEDQTPANEFAVVDFENGELSGFIPRHGDEELTIVEGVNHTEGGNYSLLVENRQEDWHGPTIDVAEYVDRGSEYEISVWVRMHEPASAPITLSVQVGDGDGASYNNIVTQTATNGEWVNLTGNFRFTSLGGGDLTIYIESNNRGASFYVDDLSFVKLDTDQIEVEKDLTPIKDVYEDYFLIGNAVSLSDFDGEAFELLELHHNLVTAENAMKPGYAYDEDGNFDFDGEDQLVQRALDNDFEIHGHVLVWHAQSRDELHTGPDGQPLDRDVAIENLRTHIRTVVEHFGEDVISWDVVNEAFRDGPPNPSDWRDSLRNSGWLRAIGPEYMDLSFRFAKEVIDENGWDIKLYYNDYNDDYADKAEAIYQMVKELNENYAEENPGELLIDGIGMQAHYNRQTRIENVRNSLEKFISLGVEVGVTELDVTYGSNDVQSERELQEQAYLYAQLFSLYKEHSEHISRVTFWGLDDATSWRSDQSPLLFDRNMQAKPAYYAVIDPEGFIESFEVEETEVRQGEAAYGTPVMLEGEIDEIWETAPILPIDRFQQAHNLTTGEARVLWDDENLYVLVEVNDSELDKSASAAHEQDSVEVFIDEQNTKTDGYGEGHGQYRVNFDNETSFNPGSIGEGFESRTIVDGTYYVVEMKIPFRTTELEAGNKVGFDVQINDASNGSRDGVTIWNDFTGAGFQSPAVFGELTLLQEETEVPGDIITDLEEQIRDLTERLEDLENLLAEERTELEQRIADLRAELAELQAGEEELLDLVADLLARLEALEDRVTELEEAEDVEDPEDSEDPVNGEDPAGEDADGENSQTPEEGTLPKTATSIYNFLLIGALILIAGAGLALYSHKRRSA